MNAGRNWLTISASLIVLSALQLPFTAASADAPPSDSHASLPDPPIAPGKLPDTVVPLPPAEQKALDSQHRIDVDPKTAAISPAQWAEELALSAEGCGTDVRGHVMNGGIVQENIGGYVVAYYGYRKDFKAFLPGTSALVTRSGDRLLDCRIQKGDLTPQLFYGALSDTNYVWLSVDQASDSAIPGILNFSAGAYGLIAGSCALIVFTGGTATPWVVEAAGTDAGLISAALKVWAAAYPTGSAPNMAQASFKALYNTQGRDGIDVPDTHPLEIPNRGSSLNTGYGEEPCDMSVTIPGAKAMTTWAGWLSLGAATTINVGAYKLFPNEPSCFAKFYYNSGLDGTNAFRVQVSNLASINSDDTAKEEDFVH